MTGYSTTDIADLVGLKPRQIRRCVHKALVRPVRAHGGAFQFQFRDLVLFRTLKDLLDARVSAHRASDCLMRVRAQLPAAKALTGVRVYAQGRAVMVRDERRVWEVESGQVCLDLETEPTPCQIAELDPDTVIVLRELDARDADAWYNLGLDLEDVDAARARAAYLRAVDLEPGNVDAHVNLGRLAQLSGDLFAAIDCYRRALAFSPSHQLALYNLGTVYDELDEVEQAFRLYRQAEQVPDAHYNLARIFELLGDQVSARRHLRNYERLLKR